MAAKYHARYPLVGICSCVHRGCWEDLPGGVYVTLGRAIMNGNESFVESVGNKINGYGDFVSIETNVSLCSNGQNLSFQDMISLFVDITQKRVENYTDFGAARREAKFTFSRIFAKAPRPALRNQWIHLERYCESCPVY